MEPAALLHRNQFHVLTFYALISPPTDLHCGCSQHLAVVSTVRTPASHCIHVPPRVISSSPYFPLPAASDGAALVLRNRRPGNSAMECEFYVAVSKALVALDRKPQTARAFTRQNDTSSLQQSAFLLLFLQLRSTEADDNWLSWVVLWSAFIGGLHDYRRLGLESAWGNHFLHPWSQVIVFVLATLQCSKTDSHSCVTASGNQLWFETRVWFGPKKQRDESLCSYPSEIQVSQTLRNSKQLHIQRQITVSIPCSKTPLRGPPSQARWEFSPHNQARDRFFSLTSSKRRKIF